MLRSPGCKNGASESTRAQKKRRFLYLRRPHGRECHLLGFRVLGFRVLGALLLLSNCFRP